MENENGYVGIFEPRCKIRFLSDPHPEEEYVALSLSEYKELLTATLQLAALESGGVDNWEWYGESIHDYLTFLRGECYDREQLYDYINHVKPADETIEEYLNDMEIKDFVEFEATFM